MVASTVSVGVGDGEVDLREGLGDPVAGITEAGTRVREPLCVQPL